MEHRFHPLLLFFICIMISSAAPDFLENPDFEIPPANVTVSIPGWWINGTVRHVEWGGGHAVQLGPNGKINQTVRARGDDVLHYVVGFTLAAINQDCGNNLTVVNVTLSDTWNRHVWRVMHLQETSLWERRALFLGQLAGGDYVNIQLESVGATTTCWPILDAFIVNRNQLPRWYNGNMMANAGFEVGPAFVKNSPNGIILNDEEDGNESPLQEWAILGTVRYIDSSHYKVPRGRAAVELLSVSSGVQKELIYPLTPSNYILNFTLGDANNSCVGDLVVGVQVDSVVHNFTVGSNGTGSAFKHSFTFKVEPSKQVTKYMSISLYSMKETRRRGDGLLCGPVLDEIYLGDTSLNGGRMQVCNDILVSTLFLAFLILILL